MSKQQQSNILFNYLLPNLSPSAAVFCIDARGALSVLKLAAKYGLSVPLRQFINADDTMLAFQKTIHASDIFAYENACYQLDFPT